MDVLQHLQKVDSEAGLSVSVEKGSSMLIFISVLVLEKAD